MKSLEEKMYKAIHEGAIVEEGTGGKAAKSCSEIAKQAVIDFAKWITDKDSMYAPMFGGTPELEKDYRFADIERDYTAEEIVELFINQKGE